MFRPLSSKTKLCLFVLSLVCSLAHADDLASTYTLAAQTNTTLLQAQETELATLELLPQARAGLLPVVSGSASTTYTYNNNPTILPYNITAIGATLAQPIFNMTSWYQYRQVDDQIKSAVASYEQAKQELMLTVATQYFNILKALDDLIFARSERIAFARRLEETHQKFNAGVIAITDVNEAQAKYDTSRAQEIAAEYEISNQKEKMGEITGVAAKDISILKYNINLQRPQPDNMEYWVDLALKQNYGLQADRFSASSAKKNIEIQRSGHYPTITANGSLSKAKTVPPFQVKAETNSIGLTLNVPIYTGGKINAQTRQAVHQYRLAVQQAIDTQRILVSNVRQAFRGILTQISQIKALQQSVISGKSALDATQAAFEVGTRTIVDVLNAQSDLLSAKSNLSKARYDYIVDSFKLKSYAGILTPQDINIINSWLQPAPKGQEYTSLDNVK